RVLDNGLGPSANIGVVDIRGRSCGADGHSVPYASIRFPPPPPPHHRLGRRPPAAAENAVTHVGHGSASGPSASAKHVKQLGRGLAHRQHALAGRSPPTAPRPPNPASHFPPGILLAMVLSG